MKHRTAANDGLQPRRSPDHCWCLSASLTCVPGAWDGPVSSSAPSLKCSGKQSSPRLALCLSSVPLALSAAHHARLRRRAGGKDDFLLSPQSY
eukprot:189838-Chlamydomonas_euryale.AAC.15